MWRAITKFQGKTTGKFWKTAVFFSTNVIKWPHELGRILNSHV